MKIPKYVIGTEIYTGGGHAYELHFKCRCSNCGQVFTRRDISERYGSLCVTCRDQKHAEKKAKEKQEKKSELRREAMKCLEEIIEVVKTTPSEADVISDRNKLVNILEKECEKWRRRK